MRRIALIFPVCFLTFVLSGCSYFSRFVVVNDSSESITIKYEAVNPNYRSLTPYFTTLKEFNSNEAGWQQMFQDDYKINIEKGLVEVKLASDLVLKISSVDAVRIQENPYEELNIKKLEIKSTDGLLKLEGKQIFNSFKPEQKGWSFIQPSYPTYVLYYK